MNKEEFNQVINEMKHYTSESIAAIYGCVSDEEGELVGSGNIIEIHNNLYLVTATHVVLKKKEYKYLAHTRDNNKKPSPIYNPAYLLGLPSDICCIRIDKDCINIPSVRPLNGNYFSDNLNELNQDILFLHGFVGEKSKFIKLFNGVVSQSYPYGTFLGKSNYPWFNSKIHIAIEYPSDGLEDEMGNLVDFVDPHGLSGSFIWRANYKKNHWTPDKSRIIGLIHNWDKDAESLIATNISVVKEFLLVCIRKEYAYFRWEHRNKPIGDDWADWFEACKILKSL